MKTVFIKHNLRLSIFLLALLFNLSAAATQGINYIDVHAAKKLYDQGALFIDSRSWIERKFGIIDGALPMKKSQVNDIAEYMITDKNQAVVTYCAVGVRASETADRLQALGYSNIYVVANGQGFSHWKRAGYPTSR